MSAFKKLKDVSNNFEADLRKVSTELFTAKIGDSFDEVVDKKLRDLSLYTSKWRLLEAKAITSNPQISEQPRDERTTFLDYEEAATTKVLEQQIVKFLTQSHAVKELITTPSSSLHPDLVERKEKIIQSLTQYSQKELELRQLDDMLKEKQEKLAKMREEWDKELGDLRDMRGSVDDDMEVEYGDLHKKLRKAVDKMELMRWLMSKLGTSRCDRYDWLTDPHRRLRALKIAREDYSMEKFLES